MKTRCYLLSIFIMITFFACKSNGIKENNTNDSIPTEKTTVDVEVLVLQEVNSTKIVKASVLKVYERPTNDGKSMNNTESMLVHTIQIEGKSVRMNLQIGKHYDFLAEGSDTLAASAIKNLKVTGNLSTLTLIQPEKRLPNRKTKIPELTSFYAQFKGEKIDIQDGVFLPLPLNAKIHASIFTHGGSSQKLFSGDFATKLGFDNAPSSFKLQSHPSLSGIAPEKSETNKKDDGWENNFRFNIIGNNMGGKAEVDFVLVSYDVVGNRLEHHTLVKFVASEYQAYPKDDIKIKNINCTIRSSTSSLHLYSNSQEFSSKAFLQSNIQTYSESKKNSYYFPSFSFEVIQKYEKEIIGVQLWRKKKEDGISNNEASPFVKASEALYHRGKLGLHVIADTYGGLETNVTYEYKIRIFVKDNLNDTLQKGFYIDSPIMPIKMMLPFEAELLTPSNHATLSSLQDFSFKLLSDGRKAEELFFKENADYFAFGLIINSFDGEPAFWNSFKYYLDDKKTDDERLEILSAGDKFRSLKELKERYNELANKTLQDFINVDTQQGVITIKKDAIIHTNRASNSNYAKCVPYYWNIALCRPKKLGFGIEIVPCGFFKETKIDDITFTATSTANISVPTAYTNNGAFTFNIDNGKDNAGIITTSYIIKIKDTCSLDFLQSLNAKVEDSLKVDNEGDESYYLITSTKNEDILPLLLANEHIISAEYDSKIELIKNVNVEASPLFALKAFTPSAITSEPPLNDPILHSACYSLDITGAYRAYKEFGFGPHKVIASIIDTGVNEGHEDLNLNGTSITKTIDSSSVYDQDGHGTHCAGIIAGLGNNNVGIAGVSWKNTELFVLQFVPEDSFKTYKKIFTFIEYIEQKRQNREIEQKTIPLNMSFGTANSKLIALEMIEKALKAGILPIVAMGNTGSTQLHYPAAYPGVIAVGSSNGKDRLSDFSSKGEHISIVAPGESIMSLGKDYTDHYISMDGTSMSTPFVTGVIAYLMSFNPNLTPLQVKTILESTADKIESNEEFNARRGYGRINVYEAVKLAKSNKAIQNKFFKGTLKIHVPSQLKNSIASIYSEKDICLFCSRFQQDGTLKIKGLLPGKYKVKLNEGIQIKRKEFELFADDENDVDIIF